MNKLAQELVFDKITSIRTDDGGQSRQVDLHVTGTENDDEGIFIRVLSWSPIGNHAILDALSESGMIVTIKDRRLI